MPVTTYGKATCFSLISPVHHLIATEHKGFLVVVDQNGDTTILVQDHSFLRSFFKDVSFVASIQTDLYSTTKKNNKAA